MGIIVFDEGIEDCAEEVTGGEVIGVDGVEGTDFAAGVGEDGALGVTTERDDT